MFIVLNYIKLPSINVTDEIRAWQYHGNAINIKIQIWCMQMRSRYSTSEAMGVWDARSFACIHRPYSKLPWEAKLGKKLRFFLYKRNYVFSR